MKVAVFSDTHSNTTLMLEAVRRCRPDAVIHLGDHDRDALEIRGEFPEIPLYNVCGNCDLMPLAPNKLTVQLGPVKAFLTHGHIFDTGFSRGSPIVDTLVYAAQEEGAQIAMFGHTHQPLYEQVGGVQVLNPGSSGKGRNPTWAIVEIFDNGGIICSIKEL